LMADSDTEWAAAFPYDGEACGALNAISLDPRLFAAVAGFLGTTDLQLTRSELRVRRGPAAASVSSQATYRCL